jgi:hypothetical protein
MLNAQLTMLMFKGLSLRKEVLEHLALNISRLNNHIVIIIQKAPLYNGAFSV